MAASGWAWWAGHDSGPRYGLQAAGRAPGPACAGLAGRRPGRLDGHGREQVGVTGAQAWGSGAVTARCGVTSPGPSADPCVSVNGVDRLLEQARSRQAGRPPRAAVALYAARAAGAARAQAACTSSSSFRPVSRVSARYSTSEVPRPTAQP
ncbi:DUF3515 family protein [Streptomyces cellostaticus]|uniref:DUF3515 family protein n=1 Tax=Streptomyces cellostaticus TaxID=67285 RepID=UPI003CC5118F